MSAQSYDTRHPRIWVLHAYYPVLRFYLTPKGSKILEDAGRF